MAPEPRSAWLRRASAAALRKDWPEAARLAWAARQGWPDDLPQLLDIAMWCRRARRPEWARAALDAAAALGPSHGVHEEAGAQDLPGLPEPVEESPASLLLDVQDLLQFLHDHGSVSGIQRVQLGILAAVLDGSAGPGAADALAVFPQLNDSRLWVVRREDLSAIVAFCAGTRLDPAEARLLVQRARMRAQPLLPRAGAALVVLGAFWFFAGAPGFYMAMRARGLRLGVLIYDTFPATHPEYATSDTSLYFNQALNEALFFWDFALAISEYSAQSFRGLVAARGYPPVETVAIPLAHSFGLTPVETPQWLDTWPAPLLDVKGRDFVLSVSTIEVRKNHLLLFHAWKRMLEAGEDPPVLVLVGRPGWRVVDLMGQLEATRNLDGRIMVVHGLSDVELAALYRACLFTVMPSFVEGWGLAVGESLSFGKPCLASPSSALPEVGGDLVAYADPGSVPEWLEKLRFWLRDRAALAAAEARIAREFTPRQWPEVARHFLAETARLMALPPRHVEFRAAPLRLPTGARVAAGISMAATQGGEGGAAAVSAALSQAISLESGWYPAEAGCTWMRGRSARFTARSDEPPGSIVTLELELGTPPWPAPNGLSVRVAGGDPVWVRLEMLGDFRLQVAGPVAGDGTVQLLFRLDEPPEEHGEDKRRLCVALRHITLHPAGVVPMEAPGDAQAQPALPLGRPPPRGIWSSLSRAGRLRRRANLARNAGDWAEAAGLYAAYLRECPRDAALHVQHGNALSMAGELLLALEAFDRAESLGDASAREMRSHALRRAGRLQQAELALLGPARAPRRSEGNRLLLDVTALLETGGSWAARRWRLGVAQGLAQVLAAGDMPHLDLLISPAGQDELWLLPRDALAGLSAPAPEQRRAARDTVAAQSSPFLAAASDRLLVLDAGLRDAPPKGWRQARQAGAATTLVLAEPATLTRPHRAAPDAARAVLAALEAPSAFDAVLLPCPDRGLEAALARLGRGVLAAAVLPCCPAPRLLREDTPPELPEGRFLLVSRLSAPVREALALLGPACPPVCLLEGEAPGCTALHWPEAAPLEALLARSLLAISAEDEGQWPALLVAAAEAGLPCLAPRGVAFPAIAYDPLDPVGLAGLIGLALDNPPAPSAGVPAAFCAGWEELALAMLAAEPALPELAGDDAPPAPLLPEAGPEAGWVSAAHRAGSGL